MIGGLDENPITRKNLSSSIPYYQDDLTWCVGKAELASLWLNVFAIFSLATWISAIALIFLIAYILYIFSQFEGIQSKNMSWSILIALSMCLNTPGQFHPKWLFLRLYFVAVFIYGMHFNAAYQSFLISVLTRPRFNPQVNTLTSAIRENFELLGGINILTHYTGNDEVRVSLFSSIKSSNNKNYEF